MDRDNAGFDPRLHADSLDTNSIQAHTISVS